MSETEPRLQQIARRLETPGLDVLTNEDMSTVFDSFIPSSDLSSRSLAYVVLAKLSSLYQQKESPENASAAVAKLFAAELESRLNATSSTPVISGLEVFRALFQVNPPAAASLFAQPELVSALEDIPEIFSDVSSPVLKPLASLLAQASSDSACRTLINERARSWLIIQSRQTRDSQLRAAAAVALTKLARGAPVASLESQTGSADDAAALQKEEQSPLKMMSNLVVSESADTKMARHDSSLVDSIEGLTHLSASSEHKDTIAKDASLLKKMFALVPIVSASDKASAQLKSNYTEKAQDARDNTVLLFGVASIISNLVSYRPPLSQADRAIDQLRRTATPGAKLSAVSVDDPAESNSAVSGRVKLLLDTGVLPALSALSQSASIGVRRAAGSAYLGLVTEQANRGKIIQGGGVKALLHISQRATYDRPPSSSPGSGSTAELVPADLLSLQALAKLTITHPPNLLFGATPRAAIGPLSNLLAHKDASTLQQFEALMALTNIASVDAEGVTKGTSARLVEELMLAEHKMVRRAAVELMCNLVGSEEIWTRYTGESASSQSSPEDPQPSANKVVQSRLHVLMALSDVDDLPTRRAASGALAMLTSSDLAVDALLSLERGPFRLAKVVTELVQPTGDEHENSEEGEKPQEHDASLTLRGVTVARNMLYNSAARFKEDLVVAAQDMGLIAALLEIVRGESSSKQTAAEALVWIGRARGQIPPA